MTYAELVSLENLFSAWEAFKKGKTKKRDVLEFERCLEDNIFALQDDLVNHQYAHRPYHQFHIFDPKFRVIHKAEVRDRVVHHLLFRYLESLFQSSFIYQSYSSQKERGTHRAVVDVAAALRAASRNYHRTVWALKLDIKKFFDSIHHETLTALLTRRVQDEHIRWLIGQVIDSYSSTQGHGRGVPIGNLTSQIFANIYLSQLDYFVKFQLRMKHYFRYADDFIILNEDEAYLKFLLELIHSFLDKKLLLTIHPQKIVLRKFHQGIDFVGSVIFPHHRILRTKTKQRMFRKARKMVERFNVGAIDEFTLQQSTQSYLGLLQHCNGNKIEEQLRNEIWRSSVRQMDANIEKISINSLKVICL